MYLRDNKCSLCKCIYVFNKHLERGNIVYTLSTNLSQPRLFCPTVAQASVLLLNNQPLYVTTVFGSFAVALQCFNNALENVLLRRTETKQKYITVISLTPH